MHEVLVNRIGSLSLPRKSVVRLTARPDMTLDVYRGRNTTTQQQPVWEQIDPWQVVPRQVFTPNDCLLISVAFVVLYPVGCLWVTRVRKRWGLGGVVGSSVGIVVRINNTVQKLSEYCNIGIMCTIKNQLNNIIQEASLIKK